MTKIQSKVSEAAGGQPAKAPTKIELLVTELGKKDGATIDELVRATGWQKHSVRGAMSGSLKRKGHCVNSTLVDGVRRYRIGSL